MKTTDNEGLNPWTGLLIRWLTARFTNQVVCCANKACLNRTLLIITGTDEGSGFFNSDVTGELQQGHQWHHSLRSKVTSGHRQKGWNRDDVLLSQELCSNSQNFIWNPRGDLKVSAGWILCKMTQKKNICVEQNKHGVCGLKRRLVLMNVSQRRRNE